METDGKPGIERRAAPRAVVRTELKIYYPDLRQFSSAVCRDISVGGMFVESEAPLPAGAEIRFDLFIPTSKPQVAHGEGVVAWCRGNDEARSQPAGFGVRFRRIEPSLRELIYRVVDRYIQTGGDPFDLEGASG